MQVPNESIFLFIVSSNCRHFYLSNLQHRQCQQVWQQVLLNSTKICLVLTPFVQVQCDQLTIYNIEILPKYVQKFAKIINGPFKICQNRLKFSQSSKIQPNLVTLFRSVSCVSIGRPIVQLNKSHFLSTPRPHDPNRRLHSDLR